MMPDREPTPLTVHWRHQLRRALTEDGAEFLEARLGMTFPWLFRPQEWIVGFKVLPSPEDEIAQLRATRLPDEPGLAFEAITSHIGYDPVLLNALEEKVVAALDALAHPLDRPIRFRAPAPDRDQLTGILNRHAFRSQIELIARQIATPTSRRIWIYLLDIDNFGAINDADGHAVGDQVLNAVTTRLEAHLPQDVTLGRLAGDEFGAAWAADAYAGESLVNTIHDAFREPLALEEYSITVSISVGAASGDPADIDIAWVIGEADIALRRVKVAKKSGGNVGTLHV